MALDLEKFLSGGQKAQAAVDESLAEYERGFLEGLERKAAERAELARSVPKKKRCRACNGTGSRTKYVLPAVTGPAECIACHGSGRASAG